METIHFDSDLTDDARRAALFEAELFVFSPTRASLEFCAFARSLIEEHFEGMDPLTAQHEMPVGDYAELLGKLKPAFIHHPESRKLLRRVVEDLGADPEQIYSDFPKMRSSTSDDYLTTGIAYAWHPHRDTWYSAPFA
jgi:hypothetical protein